MRGAAVARRLQTGNVRTYALYLLALVLGLLALVRRGCSGELAGRRGRLQVGGVALAPLLPGTIQTLKARLQGRRGASPLQPYRVLRRLWGKSAVDPAGTGPGVPRSPRRWRPPAC